MRWRASVTGLAAAVRRRGRSCHAAPGDARTCVVRGSWRTGLDVVSSVSAGLSHDPGAVEAAAVCEWISRHVADAADAVFIGGNGFRAAGAIEALETAIGRPVLTSNQVLLWQLLAQADDPFEIDGYGRLFAQTLSNKPGRERLTSQPGARQTRHNNPLGRGDSIHPTNSTAAPNGGTAHVLPELACHSVSRSRSAWS